MSDRFHPISMEQLTAWAFQELEENDSLFGIPRSACFVPRSSDRFKAAKYGCRLETPFGVAAGPHSQMAQNILIAWACGARFIELKTVQTLDELEVNKPCIDLEDEGYNVEWSQELKVYESFDEYLRAWVLIHALHRKLGFPGESPGMIFNMSVGYNLEGIQKPNVEWYLDAMRDCSLYKQTYIDIVAEWYPEIHEIEIPDQISNTITLSTMHGCPPDEIEQISTYLLAERALHTSVKCNPTLLGPETVRGIINDDLGYTDVTVPDEAFGHDLKYDDAIPMLGRLQDVARREGLTFGVKLSNTLEVENSRDVFSKDEMMYLSGRALHAVTVNLALALSNEFNGDLLISFAGGADCFNVSDLLRAGMASVTVCSDLLKSGGYMRMLQYFETLDAAMDEVDALDLRDFICKSALAAGEENESADGEHGSGSDHFVRAMARANLARYAAATRTDWRLRKASLRTDRSKTPRPLDLFDCIEAPCIDECPVNQKVPQYMTAVREGRFDDAVEITRQDNPLPAILGQVCDHLCENTCIRTHFDQPLAIRDIKRFIMEHEESANVSEKPEPARQKMAVIGAGPAGLSAAQKLAQAGFEITVFEMHPYAGGMVGGAIPSYRLPQKQIDQDVAVLDELGVEIRYGQQAGVDFTLDDLRRDGYEFIFVGVGAQLAKSLGLPGEDSEGVMDALRFLRSVREGSPVSIGRRVGVIGAGDTAMDCVRSAYRLGSEVSLIYRRTIDQMPADREEIHAVIEEGAKILELASPHALRVEDGRLAGLTCTRMEYRGDRDGSGRKIPHQVPASEFDVPLDTLILAISQSAILDFFGDEMPRINRRGYIEVDPETLESSISGVYAGGDVAADGPSSIVKAAADGKRAADAIISVAHARALEPLYLDGQGTVTDLHSLIARRARREWRVPVRHTPLDERMNFDDTIVTYTPEEAMAEAGRCLDCHHICSLCVGVCPNAALMTYQREPFSVELPTLELEGGSVVVTGSSTFCAGQTYQIAVLTDFCNECGNCVTFCPTSGEPYRDKPRLYLDREDFEAQSDNAFMLFGNSVLEARWKGETHRIELAKEGAGLKYQSPAISARIETEDFSLLAAEAGAGMSDGRALSLEPCAAMYVVLQGLTASMPHLPMAAEGPNAPATKVAHPGYEE